MDKLEILRKILKYDTRGGNTKELVKFLENRFRLLGFETQIIEHDFINWNLIVRTGEYDKLVYNVHLDVVDFVPWYFHEDEKYIYAPGAVDTKTSAAALLCAFSELRNIIPRDITLVFDFDEETEGYGIEEIKKELRRVEYFITAEPTNFGIGDTFLETIEMEILIYGKKTHPARINDQNAIWNSIRVIESLKKKFGKYLSLISFISNPKDHYIMPGTAKVHFQVRNESGYGKEKFLDIIRKTIENYEYKILKTEYKELLKNKKSKIAKYLEKALKRNHIKPRRIKKLGWSNVYIFKDVDFIEFGPGDPMLSHTEREKISKDEYMKFISVLRDFFIEVKKLLEK